MNLPLELKIKSVAFQRKIRHWLQPNFKQEKFERHNSDYLILSRPSCGRTWLRVMIGKILKASSIAGIDHINPQNLFYLHQLDTTLPAIKASHEKFLGEASYRDKKVILLVRDPRGAMLSNLTKLIKRSDELKMHDFSHLLRSSKRLDVMLEFYNDWGKYQTIPQSFMILKYEDLVENTHRELKRVCDFMGLKTSEDMLNSAIGSASFDQMHKFDTRSFKFRSGKSKDFVTELNREDLEWIEKCIDESLDPSYGYNYFTDDNGL